MKNYLNRLQKVADKLYEEKGPVKSVIDLQVAINQLRNEEDIADTKERLYENFVQ